jgi:hypothetical protein
VLRLPGRPPLTMVLDFVNAVRREQIDLDQENNAIGRHTRAGKATDGRGRPSRTAEGPQISVVEVTLVAALPNLPRRTKAAPGSSYERGVSVRVLAARSDSQATRPIARIKGS